MDFMEASLVFNEVMAASETPDSMFSASSNYLNNSQSSSDVEQGFVNQAATITASEESGASSPDYMPAIEDLEEGVPESGRPRTETSDTVISQPPSYTETTSSSICCVSQRQSCRSSCNKSCIVKQAVIWTLVLAISFALAATTKLAIFNSYSFASSPSDQRQIHQFSTTYFCESVEIMSTSKFSTYVLLFPPKIEDTNPVPFKTTVNFKIAPGNFQYWTFYLLQGSWIDLHVCAKQPVDLFIFKGKDDFKTFENGCFGDSCPYMYSETVDENLCRSDNGSNGTAISTEITDTNDYYIVLSGKNSPYAVDATINIHLLKAVYTLSAIGDSLCFDQSSCLLTGTSAVYGILFVAQQNSAFNSYNHVKCLADGETYIFIFVVVPIMIGCVISVSVLLKRRESRDQDDTSTQTPRRSRTRLCSGPPTYEELFHEEEARRSTSNGVLEPPPPYPGQIRTETNNTETEDQNTGQQSASGDDSRHEERQQP